MMPIVVESNQDWHSYRKIPNRSNSNFPRGRLQFLWS